MMMRGLNRPSVSSMNGCRRTIVAFWLILAVPPALVVRAFPSQQDGAMSESDPFRDLIEVRVHSKRFEALVRELQLSERQATAAQAAFDSYQQTVTLCIANLRRDIVRRLGSDTAEGLAQTLRGMDGAAAADFIDWLHRGVKGLRSRSDSAREKLLNDLSALLREDQAARWAQAAGAFTRGTFLNPMIDPTGPNGMVDLGVKIDLNDLVAAASEPGGELHPFLSPEAPPPIPDAVVEARQRIIVALVRYNEQLEHVLPGIVYRSLDAKQSLRSASFRGDSASAARHHSERVRLRKVLFDMNEAAAQEIAIAVREIDNDSAVRWLRRVDQAHFPETMRTTTVDMMQTWLTGRDLDETTRVRVQAAYRSFVPVRDAIWRTAKPLVLRMHNEVSMYVAGSENNDVFEKLDEVDAAMAQACATAHASVITLLPPEEQTAYRSALSRLESQSGPAFDSREALRRRRESSLQ